MPDQESLSHPGERLPNWLARSLSQAFTPRASAVAPQRRSSELSDDEDFDFVTTTSTTTATAGAGAAAPAMMTRRSGVHDAFKPSNNNNAITLTASIGGPQGWNNASAAHQAPLHQSGLDLAFHNLSFRAGGKGKGGKDILREASGYALAGRLTAVQGPSGAGKVSFCSWEGRERGRGAGGAMASFSCMSEREHDGTREGESPRRPFGSPKLVVSRVQFLDSLALFFSFWKCIATQQHFGSCREALEVRATAEQSRAPHGFHPSSLLSLSPDAARISRLKVKTSKFSLNLDLFFSSSFKKLKTPPQSTLLKILACNVSGGEVHGSIYVNGNPIVAREFRAASAVVWQRDILLPTATVREAIMTSAELKLPQGMAWEEKRRRVDQIVTELVREKSFWFL